MRYQPVAFSRFLGLAIEDSIPDATTLWLFREKLARVGLIEKLFDRLSATSCGQGLHGARRADHRRQYRAGADAAEQS